MNKKSLKLRQICFFLIAFVPITKFYTMPSILASICANNGLICIAFNFLLDFITLYFIISVIDSEDKNVFTLLNEKIGNIPAKLLLFSYVIFFLFKSFIPIAEQKEYIELTLYINTPDVLNFMPFFIFVFYLCLKRLRVLGRISDILWAFTLASLIMLFALSISNINLEKMLPLGKVKFSDIISGSFSTLNWYGDSVYFLFFIGEFNKTNNYKRSILLTFLLVFLIVIIFYIVFYSTFYSIAFRQKFALTEISKYSTVINNIGRFDYIALFALILSTAFSISLPLYFAVRILNHIFPMKKNQWIISAIICVLMGAVVLFSHQYLYSIETFFKQKMWLVFLLFSNILPIAISIILRRNKNEVYSR